MSEDQIPEPTGVLRIALRAYPPSSRAEHAAEIAAIFAQATADAGRVSLVREALDVAEHGLRVRLGVGQEGRGAAVLARAVPLAMAAYVGASIGYLTGTDPYSSSPGGWPTSYRLMLGDQVGAAVLWMAVLGLMFGARWQGARVLATVGTLVQVPPTVAVLWIVRGENLHALSAALLPSIALWLLLAAVPPELLSPQQGETGLIGGVFALGLLPLLLGQVGNASALHTVTALLWALVLVIALPFVQRPGTTAGALVIAALVALTSLTNPSGAVLALLAAAALAYTWRRSRVRAHS